MASFPEVTVKDKFEPNARLSNAVRNMVNSADGFKAGAQKRTNTNVIRVACYNATTSTITSGTAVMFGETAIADDVYPIKPYDGTADALWGVLSTTIEAQGCGSAVVMGCVTVNASGSGDYVTANADGTFVRGDEGVPIIYASGSSCLILLGGGSSGSGYSGNFAVTWEGGDKLNISSGYLNCNGFEYKSISATTISLASGTLCLCTEPTYSSNGTWTTPTFNFTTPSACAYPIAEVTSNSSNGETTVTIKQFPVTVAVILYSTLCPLASF